MKSYLLDIAPLSQRNVGYFWARSERWRDIYLSWGWPQQLRTPNVKRQWKQEKNPEFTKIRQIPPEQVNLSQHPVSRVNKQKQSNKKEKTNKQTKLQKPHQRKQEKSGQARIATFQRIHNPESISVKMRSSFARNSHFHDEGNDGKE